MSVVAVTTPPSIVCPAWCTVSRDEHVADLANLEGYVIHTSAVLKSHDFEVSHSSVTSVDGSPHPSEQPQFRAHLSSDGCTLDRAEAYARAILAAVEEARA